MKLKKSPPPMEAKSVPPPLLVQVCTMPEPQVSGSRSSTAPEVTQGSRSSTAPEVTQGEGTEKKRK